MYTRKICVVAAAIVALVGISTSTAIAQMPTPPQVSGKEYSNSQDENFAGVLDYLQNIHWDGSGNAFDTFDYSTSAQAPWNAPLDPDQVDALANHWDFLYPQVTTNQVPFLASFAGVDDIYFHTTTGATGIWAQGPVDINQLSPPDDVDALEIWSGDNGQHDGLGSDDANHFSILVDAAGPNISVFFYDPILDASTPYIFENQIQAALGVDHDIDVDALMVLDGQGDGTWGPGDSITFSLWPDQSFDGGEIWVWNFGAVPQFLVHGGRVWDTPNPVGSIFGVSTENINAFEAIIPEPATLSFVVLAGLVLVRRRR